MLELLEKRAKHRPAWEAFLKKGLPSRKFDAFKYVSLNYEDHVQGKTHVGVSTSEYIQSLDTFMVNRNRFLLEWEQNPFSLLCQAMPSAELCLYVPKTPDRPIEITTDLGGLGFTKIHLVLAKNVEAKLITRTKAVGFNATLIDISLDDNAKVNHTHYPTAEGSLFENIRVTLKRDSKYSQVGVTTGAKAHYQDIRIKLNGENAEADVKGLFDLNDKSAHANLLMEHAAPNTWSNQHFKTVLLGRAEASFEGKIYIHREAQKTLAYQLVNHLMLGEKSKAYSKPNLEIFADDVKASHGATTGKLDNEQLLYLRARGLTLADAKHFLIEGFKREIACLT